MKVFIILKCLVYGVVSVVKLLVDNLKCIYNGVFLKGDSIEFILSF